MRKKPVRAVLWVVVMIAALAVIWRQAGLIWHQLPIGMDDFRNTWSAGHLYFAGLNPYDHPAQRLLQAAIDPGQAVYPSFWYLPWLLPFLAPLGALDYAPARIVWFFVCTAATLLSISTLWRVYGGRAGHVRRAWLLGVTFVPFFAMLEIGQISIFILLGLAGYLHFEGKGRPWAAGACLLLCAIKPQLAYLVFLALLLTGLYSRRGAAIGGLALAGAGLTAVAEAIRPGTIGHYLAINYGDYGQVYSTGGLLQALTGRPWTLYLPALAGAAWLAFYWANHRQAWDWREQMPLLATVSLATAPVSWIFDSVIAWVAVTSLFVRLDTTAGRRAGAWVLPPYLAINGVMAIFVWSLKEHSNYIWAPAAFLAWYVLSRQVMRAAGQAAAPGAQAAVPGAGQIGARA